jgi:dipeptidase E
MPQILALGGGGFSMEPGNTLLDDHALRLTGRKRPRVCFLPTASGDADHYVVRFYRNFAPRADASHLSLFRRDRSPGAVEGDVRTHLLNQDLIYVGGGSIRSLIGTWRAHGIDDILAEAWAAGVVLCGLSAGSLCWFDEVITAFHGPPERVRGLGLLPFSNCVHYDEEPERRDHFRDAIATGMPGGYGCQDGAALHFVGRELNEVVTSRPKAGAFRVEPIDGVVVETPLTAHFLGARRRPASALAA